MPTTQDEEPRGENAHQDKEQRYVVTDFESGWQTQAGILDSRPQQGNCSTQFAKIAPTVNNGLRRRSCCAPFENIVPTSGATIR